MEQSLLTVLITKLPNEVHSLDYYDERVYLENSKYEKIFTKKFKEQGNLPSNRGIIKISIKGSRRKIYRIFAGGNKVNGNQVGLSGCSLQILGINENQNHTFILSKSCRFYFMWDHPNHNTRIVYKISMFALFIGLLSIIITIFSLL
jgi:hypothetical protein